MVGGQEQSTPKHTALPLACGGIGDVGRHQQQALACSPQKNGPCGRGGPLRLVVQFCQLLWLSCLLWPALQHQTHKMTCFRTPREVGDSPWNKALSLEGSSERQVVLKEPEVRGIPGQPGRLLGRVLSMSITEESAASLTTKQKELRLRRPCVRGSWGHPCLCHQFLEHFSPSLS